MLQVKNTSSLGGIAEDFAASFVTSKGYKVLNRNFRSRFGEIDIVALSGDTLVFIEVKARWSRKFGFPEEAVTRSKLAKIRKTGEYYSLIHPNLPTKLRIDVLSLEIEGGSVASARIIKVDS